MMGNPPHCICGKQFIYVVGKCLAVVYYADEQYEKLLVD